VFFSASPAPDPDQSSSHWQYVSVASVLSPGSWSSWTPTSLWRQTSLLSRDRVSRHCDRSGVCGVLYLDTPYWLWSVRSWSARSTTAALSWPVFSVTNSADYSPSWTPRRDWSSRQGGQTTQLHCSVNSTGFESLLSFWVHVKLFYCIVSYRLCVLSYRCLHGTAPSYLADSLRRCADTEGRRRLRSSVTVTLVVPLTNRSTLSDRALLCHGPGMVCLHRSEFIPPATKDVPVSGLTSRILTCTELKGHCFVLVSGYMCYIKLYTQLLSPR